MTCLLDIVLILWGEILLWSLVGVKGFRGPGSGPSQVIVFCSLRKTLSSHTASLSLSLSLSLLRNINGYWHIVRGA